MRACVCVCVCVCVTVCVCERERQTDRQTDRQRKREREIAAEKLEKKDPAQYKKVFLLCNLAFITAGTNHHVYDTFLTRYVMFPPEFSESAIAYIPNVGNALVS